MLDPPSVYFQREVLQILYVAHASQVLTYTHTCSLNIERIQLCEYALTGASCGR